MKTTDTTIPTMGESDRELLELAAKAAGYAWTTLPGWSPEADRESGFRWNPLSDDGDALRIAVKLGLEVYHSINDDVWTVFVGYPLDGRIVYMHEPWGRDPMAATRRAIVRAAAAIGKETQ